MMMDETTVTISSIRDDHDSSASSRTLSFAMLGCESQPPYGPLRHTATLLAHLWAAAAASRHPNTQWTIHIKIFNAQEQEYPNGDEEWNLYDGIFLPGSFSAAYETEQPWIARLQQVIQNEIVAKQRPTLGLCFGHQVLAHSFGVKGRGGQATATPSGPRAGRYTMPTTLAGTKLLSCSSDETISTVDLFYTHSDMVQQLPDSALSLGGSDLVPIQAAAYFASSNDATLFSNSSATDMSVKPFAVTFQGHPEYACSLDVGVHGTLLPILDAMVQRGSLSPEQRDQAREDAVRNFAQVQRDCLATMATVGQWLGWFPGFPGSIDEYSIELEVI